MASKMSFYDTQGDVVKIPIWPLFLQKFRVPSLARKSLQLFEHGYLTISKYKLWHETPILLLIHARTNNGFNSPPPPPPTAVIFPIRLHYTRSKR